MIRGKGDIKSGEVEAFLGKNSSFEGKMGFEGMAGLDGKFDGEIFSGDILIIGETAAVNAEINVSSLLIDGKVFFDRLLVYTTGTFKYENLALFIGKPQGSTVYLEEVKCGSSNMIYEPRKRLLSEVLFIDLKKSA